MVVLAQVDAVLLRAPLSSPEMCGFAAAFDPVNRLAERSPGFVWRLQEDGRAPVRPDDSTGGALMVNVSTWTSYEALHDFVYRSQHGALLRSRARWCLPQGEAGTALWWAGDAARPDVDEALERLAFLRRYGPGPRSFGVRRRFDPTGARVDRHRPVRR